MRLVRAGRGAAFACLLPFAAALLTAQSPAVVPWAAGEHLEYAVRMVGMNSGTGVMEVVGIDTMRGRPSWRLHFNIKGSAPFGTYHVDDSYDSWMDMESLNSLRFEQRLYEGGKHTNRSFNIFPTRGMFEKEGDGEYKSVANPLDDASFFFFVRTLPLDVGTVYTLDNYYDPKANPVVIKVVRKDTINVPAGRFPAIVLQPTIKTSGLFKDGRAEIWLSDDDHRILLQLQTTFAKVISLGLQLKTVRYTSAAQGAPPEKRR